MNNEPRKHHYIPQFILRNFCINDTNQLYYRDVTSKALTVTNTNNIFMVKDLYRNEMNDSNDPVQIEKDLSTFEAEIARLVNVFLTKKVFDISFSDVARLEVFLALQSFRSKYSSDFFSKKMDQENIDFYSKYQPDLDMGALWKRNLGHAVKCRSLEEILDNADIDETFKVFLTRDIFGLMGRYFVVAESREQFVISDCYPTVMYGETDRLSQIDLCYFFPISSQRIIVLVSNGTTAAPKGIRHFTREFLYFPDYDCENRLFHYQLKRINPEQTRWINNMIKKNAKIGIAANKKQLLL